MFIAPIKPNASSANTVRGDGQTRFGAATTKVAKQGAEIAYLGIAKDWIQPAFKWAKSDIRVGGLSLEDMAGRLLTLIGIYIPQGYFACRDNKHPWETNGRNAVVWLMTLGLTSLTKSENFGVNTLLLNPLMQQKGSAVRYASFLQAPMNLLKNKLGIKVDYVDILNKQAQFVMDKLRMDVDYVDILKDAKISLSDAEKEGAIKGTKALWASSWLDANKVEKIQNHFEELKAKEATEPGLTVSEKAMKEAIPKFFKRINSFNFVSTALITAATVYFIGGVAMKIVNKLFTPLDKDQDKLKPVKPLGQAQPQSMILHPGMPYPPLYGYNRQFGQPFPYRGLH